MCQIGEAAQLRRYLPAQVVPAEAQLFRVGEAAQLGGISPLKALPERSSRFRLPLAYGTFRRR